MDRVSAIKIYYYYYYYYVVYYKRLIMNTYRTSSNKHDTLIKVSSTIIALYICKVQAN